MPNWCLNEVRISFEDEETRKEFEKAIEGERREVISVGPNEEKIDQWVPCPVMFSSILPEPTYTVEGEGFDEKYILENGEVYDWYNWRVQHWGTKWEPDIIHYDVELDGREIYMELYTAWGPPAGIYNKLCEDWEDKGVYINWFYREDGMQFAGWLPE